MKTIIGFVEFLIVIFMILCVLDYLGIWGLDFFDFITPGEAIFSGIFKE